MFYAWSNRWTKELLLADEKKTSEITSRCNIVSYVYQPVNMPDPDDHTTLESYYSSSKSSIIIII